MIISSVPYKKFNFPCGETHIQLHSTREEFPNYPLVEITFEYENDAEIIELLLLCDAIKRVGGKVNKLNIPYVPFSRQDRINQHGECFSLKVFCNLVNSIEAELVTIIDPHSDVVTALIDNVEVTPQHEVFYERLRGRENFFLVSPDAGALKKMHKLAQITSSLGIVECSKKRNTLTGEITGVNVPCAQGIENEFIIVDDICDGGKTFVEIAVHIKMYNPKSKIFLCVTHGFFTKGLNVFEGLIAEIYTRKGRVK